MKRFLPFILISSVILQFFAPFAIGVGSGIINKNIAFGEPLEDKNKSMERVTWDIDGYIKAFSGSFLSSNGSMYYKEENSSELNLAVTMDTGVPEGESAFGNWWHVKRGSEGVVGWLDRGLGPLSDGLYFKNFKEEKNLILFIEEVDTKKTGYLDITKNVLQGYLEQGRNLAPEVDATPVKITKVINIKKNITPIGSDGVSFLSPGKNYKISFYYLSGIENLPQEFPDLYEKYRPGTAEKLAGLEKNGPYYIKIASGIFPVASETNQIISPNLEDLREAGTTKGAVGETMLPDCGFRNIGGCIARIFYYVLFVPTSFLFGLAGKVMDFTIMYSVSDSSYRTPFVSEGWKVVRDLCNMFFIFILLYIAITTILDVGGSKNKSSVINVIIIGLFINFSLFATHLIIDASNIMARVFYNPKVLVIGEKDETSGEVKNERDSETGTIQLSQAIVSKINPQRLLEKDNQNVAYNQAGKITKDSKITTNENTEDQGITAGTFILVTLMASIVNFIGMMTFLTISLSFIGRVVGLWVAMVLSPLAFLSYTIPETKKWDYVGWSSWWSETIKASFMAPVFVFFMYIIVMFLESGIISNMVGDGSGLTNFNKILSVIIPFIVIIVLLKQAEKISTKLAGQVAGTVTSAVGNVGAKVGGLALGGALGAGAFAMRSTIGKMGAGLANSEKLQNAEAKGGFSGWGARQLRNVGSFTGKSSFDVRSTKVGQTAGKQMGVEGLGKGKAGGYVEYQNSIEKRKTARADTFKSSDAKAAEQDAAAKEYNDKYQRSMYAKKREVENSGGTFDEKAYKEEYKNNIKEQEKNERIQELARKGKSFDQKEQDKFEKEYTEKHKNDGKSSEEIYRDRVKTYKESVKRDGVWGANDSTMARIDKSLKDKSKDPNAEKPLTHKENFLAERNKLKAKNKIDEVENTITKMEDVKKAIGEEMEDINKELADVANTLGQTIAPENINKEHIKQAVEKIRGDVSGAEARIISLNNILAQNPGSQVAQRELIEANKAKRDGEAKIKNMSNVLERKNKNKEKETSQLSNIERQQSIIQKQKEIIEKEQETIDRYEREQTKKP